MRKRVKWILSTVVCSAFVLFSSAVGFSAVCEDYEEVTHYLNTLVEDGKATSWIDYNHEYIPADHCAFAIDFIQPVDHNDPDGPTFTQTIVLDHRSKAAPTVFRPSGYEIEFGRGEPSRILNANQLSAGHRYFGDIDASVHGYDYLNEFQAASDHNAIVLAIAPFYTGAFLVSGASKGGENVAFFQYYYPETHEKHIDGGIAYVAPICRGRADHRFRKYIAKQLKYIGCKQKMVAFQREALNRRNDEDFLALLDDYGDFSDLPGGKQALIDGAVSTYSFVLLQYIGHCDNVPSPDATHTEILEALNDVTQTFDIMSKIEYREALVPYQWQIWTHQGYGANYTQPLIDKLLFNTDNMESVFWGFDGLDPSVAFDGSVMANISRWAKKESKNMIFLYGSVDPWTAAAYDVGRRAKRRDVHKFILQGGTHGAELCDLPEPQRIRAMRTIKRWTGVMPQCTSSADSAYRGMPQDEAINFKKRITQGHHRKLGQQIHRNR